jgi:UDP-galactopyranose mutase
LVAALATAHPDWQIVLVGPVVKIDPATLPRRPNLHYLGQKEYAELPAYLSGWDVCLLPFARNDATKFISPTKTLEYMAAEKPIVSTPIADVADPYSHIVYLGGTTAEFVEACEQALASSQEERAERAAHMRRVLARTSWDSTVSARAEEVDKITARKPASTRSTLRLATPPLVVVGAGPTGLSAAYHLGAQSLLIERNPTVGGWCRSLVDRGFTFDFAGHIMFSKEDYVHQMYQMLLGENVHWQDREAWIYSKGVYTRYPFQGALYGLPPEVIKECIMGAIEARFGPVKKNGNGSCQLNDCCADGIAESTAVLGKNDGNGHDGERAPGNFEEFIYQVWGAGIAKHFAIPYNRKLWAVPLSEMETSWLGGRVPLPDLEEMIEGALKPVAKPMGPNARFGYPLRGGFQALMNGFLPLLKGELRLNTAVVGLAPRARLLKLSTGEIISYDSLISTMPLKTLVRLMGNEAPRAIQQAAAGLRHVSVRCVNIGVGRERLTEKHWIYYPEDTVFHRIFVQGNASPHCNPPGGFGLTCEITYSPSKPLPCDGDELVKRCLQDCRRVGIIQSGDPIWATNQVDMPCAYVVYDHARAQNVATIRSWLEQQGIFLAGRYSEWEYYNSDHAFIARQRCQ